MTARPIPKRHWLSYGDDPLPTPAEALSAPLSAFPSWFIRMECERCGRERYTNEVHLPQWKEDDRTTEGIVGRPLQIRRADADDRPPRARDGVIF